MGNQQNKAPLQGKLNHTTAESAAEASNVLLGTFSVNSTPAIVLFDTGATHAFISVNRVCPEIVNLPTITNIYL